MRYIDEYRDSEAVSKYVNAIRRSDPPKMTVMEVCGTHTMAIGRFGIRQLIPAQINLISGPGCPVCVTPQSDIDAFIDLAARPNVTVTTFGDMLRVPGSKTSLEAERARGADVRIVYSPMDALEIARRNPAREVVFFGVGFETTTPGIALTISQAAQHNVSNFTVYSAHKTVPEALSALLSGDAPALDGFLLPGHVSTMIGSRVYEPIARDFGVACVIAGFEPLDILQSILMLVKQVQDDRAEVENQYRRVVTPDGNDAARRAVAEIFKQCDAAWRGIGVIPKSGLTIRSGYSEYDARVRFGLPETTDFREPDGCQCGAILKGQCQPPDCPLFGTVCTPAQPVGPCMVSSEGTCAAWHKYGAS
jgi:hydrogenase expression/formation protein HypD